MKTSPPYLGEILCRLHALPNICCLLWNTMTVAVASSTANVSSALSSSIPQLLFVCDRSLSLIFPGAGVSVTTLSETGGRRYPAMYKTPAGVLMTGDDLRRDGVSAIGSYSTYLVEYVSQMQMGTTLSIACRLEELCLHFGWRACLAQLRLAGEIHVANRGCALDDINRSKQDEI